MSEQAVELKFRGSIQLKTPFNRPPALNALDLKLSKPDGTAVDCETVAIDPLATGVKALDPTDDDPETVQRTLFSQAKV